MAPKPPIGVSPYWFVYPKRIKELSEAITSYIDYAITNNGIISTIGIYSLIAKWAAEVKILAELMVEQESK